MKRKIQFLLSFLAGAFLIWFLFKDANWPEVLAAIQGVDVRWLLAAQIPILASFFTRIQRWRYIVHATAPHATYRGMFTSTQIGFLANFTLPMRLGEFVRAFALGKFERLAFSKSFALVGLDRLTDIAGLLVVLLISVAAFPKSSDVSIPAGTFAGLNFDYRLPPGAVQSGSIVTGIVLVAAIGMLVMLYVNQERVFRLHDWFARGVSASAARVIPKLSALLERIFHKTRGVLKEFADGLHIFRSPSDMFKSIFFSLVTWGMFVLAFVFFAKAFHIDMPWYGPFVIQSLLAVMTSVPIAPGFVGQFHLAIVMGVLIVSPGVDSSHAKALALVIHLLNLIPVVLIGAVCLFVEWGRLFEIPGEMAAVEAKWEEQSEG